MVRKLEKIEKEMGYCEIKLEKERRLRKQVEYLRADIEVFDRFLLVDGGSVRPIREIPFSTIAEQITAERQSRTSPGPFYKRARDEFVGSGVVELVQAEKEVLAREIEQIEAKFGAFSAFGTKRDRLQEEKRAALASVASDRSGRVRKLNEEFKKIEHLWNSLTEDALNLEEAVFFLSRNVDYMRSARSFLISAKGSFDIESWMDDDYASELFRHSNIGRSKEMVDGANRNLTLAQKELVCVENVSFEIDRFEPVLVAYLGALFDDIFLDGRIERTIAVVEEAITESEKRLERAHRTREELHEKLERAEEARGSLFQKLGDETLDGTVAAN